MRNAWRVLAPAVAAVALCAQPGQALGQSRAGPAQQGPPTSRPPGTRYPMYVPPADPRASADRPGVLDGGTEGVVSLYRRTLEFARCIQHTHPQRLAALLEKPVSSRAEELAADRLLRFTGSCPGGRLRVSARMLRGAAAESILENFAAAAPDRARHVNNAQMADFAWAMPSVDRVHDRISEDIQNFVGCQIGLAPGLARKLIVAEPGSTRAHDAAEELASATRPCGVVSTQGGPALIAYRSYLAEALYHWTRATASDQVS